MRPTMLEPRFLGQHLRLTGRLDQIQRQETDIIRQSHNLKKSEEQIAIAKQECENSVRMWVEYVGSEMGLPPDASVDFQGNIQYQSPEPHQHTPAPTETSEELTSPATSHDLAAGNPPIPLGALNGSEAQ